MRHDARMPARPRVRPRRRAREPLVVCLGDLALDVVVRPSAPLAHATDVAGTVAFLPGGSAANAARSVARAGGRSAFIGSVGRDGWGTRLVESLRADKVTVHAPRRDGTTATIGVIVGADGERSFVTQRSAADALAPGDLRAAWFRGAGVLHLTAYSLLAQPVAAAAARAVELARAAGAAVSLDLASARPLETAGRRSATAAVAAISPDLVFATPAEARAVTGTLTTRGLLALAPIVIVKEGRGGARVFARPADGELPPLSLSVATTPVTATDATGAGDAFDAGFLMAWLAAGGMTDAGRGAAALRRAAVAGNRAAAKHLATPRTPLRI
jgi:sugar/nucleoside kinase (ribokinase family)